MELQERILGGVLGLAVGDALGVPVEFSERNALRRKPVTGMQGGGYHRQPAGTWSDDTSLAMCLQESLLAAGFSPEDAGRRFVDWRDPNYWTARGSVFDVGGATGEAIDRMKRGTPAVQAATGRSCAFFPPRSTSPARRRPWPHTRFPSSPRSRTTTRAATWPAFCSRGS